MKIFVTGSGGLVGRNLIENEKMAGHEILHPRSVELDLTDYNRVREYIGDNKPDMIIHCAGKVGGIAANMKDMYGFFTQNAVMGINLVRAAREIEIKNFLNLSSSCTYPRDYKNPLREEYVLQAELEPTNEGYAMAKLAVMRMCEYITREHAGYNYKTLIPCNLYGKYDKFGETNAHMIPAIIRKIHNAKENNLPTVEIWGDGMARREFMYVGDLANAITYAIDKFDKMPTLMNVGLGHDYTVNEYYNAVREVIGWNGEFTHDTTKPVGMKQKLLDISRQTEFGWKPKTSLREGILQTYQFYIKEHTK